jgi:hypothetical protein
MQQTLSSLLILVSSVFLVGALGGLGILGGEQIAALAAVIKPAAVSDLGSWLVNALAVLVAALANLLTILGSLVELSIVVFAATVFGATLTGIIGNIFGAGMRRLSGVPGRFMGGVLGAISGAMLMILMAVLGMWASLLGVLPMLGAGILGGTLVRLLLQQFLPASAFKRILQMRLPRMIIFYGSGVFVALMAFNLLNVGRTLIDGTLPAQTLATLGGVTLPVSQYIFSAAVIGAVLTYHTVSPALSCLQIVPPP